MERARSSSSPVGLVLAFIIVSSSASSIVPRFLGIAPQDVSYYSRDVISCRDGSRTFSKDRLNDGFCDCPDGTDEPGTSACPESKFYCRNIGDNPRMLYSSRVNDHICDCCDGSDEYDGHIICPNTCSKNGVVLNNTDTFIVEKQTFPVKSRRKNIVNLERLVENLTDLSIAIVVELIIIVILLSCFFCRYAKSWRRYLFNS